MRQLVTSADLTAYFSPTSREAQALLPLLVRRLIVGTSSVGTLRQLTMPSGDDVRLTGLDGRLLLDAIHPYIPSGSSVWEMGIGANPKQKADSDFNKRTADPAGVDQACTTFVFVTPHVWAGKDAWAAEKRSEGPWKSVVAIDGQMLSEWMDLAPAVAAWFCAARRCPVRHIDDSDAMWRRLIESRVDLRVTPAVVIGNRDTEADQLRRWLAAPKGELHLLAESNEEAMAFVAAVVKSDDAAPSDANASSRVLFAHDAGALPYLGSVHTQHVVVAANSRVAADLRAHPSPMVSPVLPSPRQPSTSSSLAKGVIVLPPLRRETLRKDLVATGLLDRRADQIARESRGSLEAVLLSVETPITTDAPWLQPDVAHSLTSLVLAGSWAVAKGPDHDAVSRLADLSWVDIERVARSWLSPKSPLQIWGDYWDWKAWRSSWRRLAPHFTKDQIERFCEVACTVLGTRAPALDLSPDQRWLAAIYNKTQPHSSMLRGGLVNSIAMFSVAAEHVGCVDGRQIAARLVRQLLEEGSLADSWRSLASWLPDLAEAAPDAFLLAVDKVLDDPTAPQWLYEEAGSFGPSGCHIHVWWALERLAWQPEHTARAVIALGRFVSTEREGTTSNRPSSSLTQIFMPWHPNTFANLAQRLAAFEQLCAACPDAGWRCAMSNLTDCQKARLEAVIAALEQTLRTPPSEIDKALKRLKKEKDAAKDVEQVIKLLEAALKDQNIDPKGLEEIVKHSDILKKAIKDLKNAVTITELVDHLVRGNPSETNGLRALADIIDLALGKAPLGVKQVLQNLSKQIRLAADGLDKIYSELSSTNFDGLMTTGWAPEPGGMLGDKWVEKVLGSEHPSVKRMKKLCGDCPHRDPD